MAASQALVGILAAIFCVVFIVLSVPASGRSYNTAARTGADFFFVLGFVCFLVVLAWEPIQRLSKVIGITLR